MLKEFGLVPSLISALDDPYVSEGLPYWGGQAVWKDILGTLPKVVPSRGTPFQSDAEIIVARRADQISRRRLSRRQGGARRCRQPDRGRDRTADRAINAALNLVDEMVPGERSMLPGPIQHACVVGEHACSPARCGKEATRCAAERGPPIAFLTPYLLVFAVFWVWPIISSFLISFQATRTVPWRFAPGLQLGPADRRPGLLQRAEEHAAHPGHPGAGDDRARDRAWRCC